MNNLDAATWAKNWFTASDLAFTIIATGFSIFLICAGISVIIASYGAWVKNPNTSKTV